MFWIQLPCRYSEFCCLTATNLALYHVVILILRAGLQLRVTLERGKCGKLITHPPPNFKSVSHFDAIIMHEVSDIVAGLRYSQTFTHRHSPCRTAPDQQRAVLCVSFSQTTNHCQDTHSHTSRLILVVLTLENQPEM